MKQDFPFSRDLVLVGGGHTHALVLRRWGMQPLAGVRVTIINPGPTAPYSGMLPGFVAGHYSRDDLDIDLIRLARFAGARWIDGAVTAIDPDTRTITVPGRPAISYDVASIDIGITSDMPNLPGFADHGVPAKPLGQFAERWEAYRARAGTAPEVAVIGGGVAGAELALAMAYALTQDGVTPQVRIVERGRALSALGATARRKMKEALASQGVEIVENARISEITGEGLTLEDGRSISAGFVTGAAGATAHDWPAQIGVKVEDGFLVVDPCLQTSDPAIFAVGDCAHMASSPRPKAGVYAVRQAPVLFENLRAALSGGVLTQYRPQRDYLKLVSLGRKSALAEKFGTAAAGPLLWRWKDRIDQTFMRQFRDLPVMERPRLPRTRAEGLEAAYGAKPMCGGCGAKVGRGTLKEVLADLGHGADGDDAAVLDVGGETQVISTDHLRGLVEDPVVMARIAAVHALGDVWAMGVKPQAVLASVTLPRQSADLQGRALREIMQAAAGIVQAAGARIVGGHTALGSELSIGFTVTGLAKGRVITLAGAVPGDALILTKPIGSGTIMAAEMAGSARGADVIAAVDAMQMPQGAASAVLAKAAHAMTDVTGFGLAGHLAGICAASGCSAELNLEHIPVLPGAMALADAGVRSSLFAENVIGAGAVQGPAGPLFDLMFDPQTAGGLLAAVPRDTVGKVIAELKAQGYDQAAQIGSIVDGSGGIRLAP